MPKLTDKMNRIGDNVITLTDHMNELDLQATLSKVDTTLGYVQLMTEKMNRKDNTLGLLLNDSALQQSDSYGGQCQQPAYRLERKSETLCTLLAFRT